MDAIVKRVETLAASGMLGQLVRFAVAGVISTLVYAAVYLPLTAWVFPGPRATYAVPFAFAVAVAVGFPLHSRWSFRGHGTRRRGGGQQFKFVVVQGSGLLLNALLTWLVTDIWRQPPWVALIPVVTLTPIATFAINRKWVFG